MTATYRIQLTPEFGFTEVIGIIPYLRRLGVSHLYLSPLTEAVGGSRHGYDVTDHNTVRAEFGGREGFDSLRQAAVAAGLALVLDIVPNHAGVGPGNPAWQDLLAYGPASAHAKRYDVDWDPLKPELKGKVLLPFLGRPYGDALDDGEIELAFDDGYFYASYYEDRFRLCPATYAELLEDSLPALERQEGYFDLLELLAHYRELRTNQRERAEALRPRLAQLGRTRDLGPVSDRWSGTRLHELLERQHWRLAYWKTAGDEINYRRFFDINGLVALRMEDPAVFFDAHRLVGELLLEEGVEGLRIDHVDGLVDPHGYLERLSALGAKRVWVEKILAPGETLPDDWAVCGTTGYEFMNDVVRLLVWPAGEVQLRQAYARFAAASAPYEEEVARSKELVMETTLSGELNRLANMLYRLSEADYHTRDFTLTGLREALAGIIARFDRYRTYLPYDAEEAGEVIGKAVAEAKRRAVNVETSVYDFVRRCLTEPLPPQLEAARRDFAGRFQQYTAPVAAKGVEDTAFYRHVPLVGLNEVGGEPDHFALDQTVFHSRARFRQHRYPENLLATATHDHKRGEDTRMRLAALSELGDRWQETLRLLDERAQLYWLETTPLGAPRISQRDAYLLYQHQVALWHGQTPEALAPRLEGYMLKAVREAKEHSSWIAPDEAYEAAVLEFTRATCHDPEVARAIEPLAADVARYGFANTLCQVTMKLTTPGIPDIYQGSELLDLSLVDPDNRRPVDYEARVGLLDWMESDPPATWEELESLRDRGDERLKFLVLHRLLSLRREHPRLFRGGYRPLEAEGAASEHLIAYAREDQAGSLLVIVPRFLAVLESAGGWGDTALMVPEDLQGEGWSDLWCRRPWPLDGRLDLEQLPLLPIVLYRAASSGATAVDDGGTR